MKNLKSPISKVASVIRVRSEGLGLRATGRCFGVHKNTVSQWENKFAEQKAPLTWQVECQVIKAWKLQVLHFPLFIALCLLYAKHKTRPRCSQGWSPLEIWGVVAEPWGFSGKG